MLGLLGSPIRGQDARRSANRSAAVPLSFGARAFGSGSLVVISSADKAAGQSSGAASSDGPVGAAWRACCAAGLRARNMGSLVQMTTGEFEYTGVRVLEAMEEARNYNAYLTRVVLDARPSADARILDFGSGLGTYADMFKARGIVVDCLEPDEGMRDGLAKKGYSTVTDAEELADGSYDLIYALNVFEHIEDDFDAFAKVARALKPGGVAVVYVPAFQSLYSSFDKLVGHFRRYRKPRLRQMAERDGLDIVKLGYCDPLGYLAALAYKLRGSKDGELTAGGVRLYDRLAFPLSRTLEPLFANVGGKNVVLVARKPRA